MQGFGRMVVPEPLAYGGLSPVSRGYPPPQGRLATCYSAVRQAPGFPETSDLHGLALPREQWGPAGSTGVRPTLGGELHGTTHIRPEDPSQLPQAFTPIARAGEHHPIAKVGPPASVVPPPRALAQ
jgi:hypothetical protein